MIGDAQLDELGTFLKARRGELTPRQVGLPADGGARRVTGLRREEVAQLAAITTDYYTRVEQGCIHVSAPVLSILAEVLRLDCDQRAYLFSLAASPRAGRLGKPSRRSGRNGSGCSMTSARSRRWYWAGGWTSSAGAGWPR